jgi:hypothetical protein
MLDGVLPRSRELSLSGSIRIDSTLADNEAETNMSRAPLCARRPGGLVTAAGAS